MYFTSFYQNEAKKNNENSNIWTSLEFQINELTACLLFFPSVTLLYLFSTENDFSSVVIIYLYELISLPKGKCCWNQFSLQRGTTLGLLLTYQAGTQAGMGDYTDWQAQTDQGRAPRILDLSYPTDCDQGHNQKFCPLSCHLIRLQPLKKRNKMPRVNRGQVIKASTV